MDLQTYPTAVEFLSRVQADLEMDEVVNNLILGLSLRLVKNPDYYRTIPYFVTVADGTRLVLAGVRTPPYNLILSGDPANAVDAIDLLIRQLQAEQQVLPGVVAIAELADTFAQHYSQTTGIPYRLARRERVYELVQVHPIREAPGSLRKAQDADLDLLVQWTRAFNLEAIGKDEAEAVIIDQARNRLNDTYLWEDGQVVSLAAVGRLTPHGATVGPVYTPPERRGRGYASACVASLSQLLLDSGHRFCCLFTDLANPTSNHIYQDIGYQPREDFHEYQFEDT